MEIISFFLLTLLSLGTSLIPSARITVEKPLDRSFVSSSFESVEVVVKLHHYEIRNTEKVIIDFHLPHSVSVIYTAFEWRKFRTLSAGASGRSQFISHKLIIGETNKDGDYKVFVSAYLADENGVALLSSRTSMFTITSSTKIELTFPFNGARLSIDKGDVFLPLSVDILNGTTNTAVCASFQLENSISNKKIEACYEKFDDLYLIVPREFMKPPPSEMEQPAIIQVWLQQHISVRSHVKVVLHQNPNESYIVLDEAEKGYFPGLLFPSPVVREECGREMTNRFLTLQHAVQLFRPKSFGSSAKIEAVNIGAGLWCEDTCAWIKEDDNVTAIVVDANASSLLKVYPKEKTPKRIIPVASKVTQNNVSSILEKYFNQGEDRLAVVKIDIDSDDAMILRSLLQEWRPWIVVIEVNPRFPPPLQWCQTSQRIVAGGKNHDVTTLTRKFAVYGCSLSYVAKQILHNYNLVQLNMNEAMFVRRDLVPVLLPIPSLKMAWILGFYSRPRRRQCFWWLNSSHAWQKVFSVILRGQRRKSESCNSVSSGEQHHWWALVKEAFRDELGPDGAFPQSEAYLSSQTILLGAINDFLVYFDVFKIFKF